MTAGGATFLAGLILTIGSAIATILVAHFASQEAIDSRWLGKLLGTLICVGLALVGTGGIAMMIELSNSVPCVPDQSMLAGVCVPADQAG